MSRSKAVERLTFFAKQETVCPVCRTRFHREEMRAGRGRLIAGDLTEELHLHYKTSTRYSALNPLFYPVTVCPFCYHAAYDIDFDTTPSQIIETLKNESERRIWALSLLFPKIDFANRRTPIEGMSSYYLAMVSYDNFPPDRAPTVKQAVSSLRAAWIARDLHVEEPTENWDLLAGTFYRKARYLYTVAADNEQRGMESISSQFPLGPDIDKDWGFDGLLYLVALLDVRYGPREDRERRRVNLENDKRIISRIFGMGKSSRLKPSILLEYARTIFEAINEELQ